MFARLLHQSTTPVEWHSRESDDIDLGVNTYKELIENAIEHNDQSTPRIEITITAIEERNMAVVTVEDNGPRIPQATWEIIKSGQETPMRHAEGIGLWVIYWSISTLGGTIGLTSNEPRGNKITLEVPLTETLE